MSMGEVRRWESGALAHGVSDPFGQGPLPWLRGEPQYLEHEGQVIPWYVDLAASTGKAPASRTCRAPVPPTTYDGRSRASRPRARSRRVRRSTSGSPWTRRRSSPSTSTGSATTAATAPPRSAPAPGSPASRRPAPLAAGRTVSCHHWWQSWRLQIPPYWKSGAYVAVLTTADGYRSHVPFTVRDLEATADLLLLLPDITWQAYNLYPEDGRSGASLYHAWDDHGRLLGEEEAATTVSFDRPYAGAGLPLHIGHAYDFVRFAERYGYDLSYADARDLHAGRVDPTRYRGLVFPGHDEYWSRPMRRAAEAAREAGTSLVFLSSNTMYWQVDLTTSPTGDPDRLLSCRKRHGEPKSRSALWRDQGEPEQLLLGVQYAGRVPQPSPLVVRNAQHWLWEATGAAEGDEIADLVAGEADHYFPRVPLPESTERILLAHSPYESTDGRMMSPGDVALPGAQRRVCLRLGHLRLVPGPGPARPCRLPYPARHRQPARSHLQTGLTSRRDRPGPTPDPRARPTPAHRRARTRPAGPGARESGAEPPSGEDTHVRIRRQARARPGAGPCAPAHREGARSVPERGR